MTGHGAARRPGPPSSCRRSPLPTRMKEVRAMATAVGTASAIPWWKEPTKDQWLAWWAGWLGWTLDAFDFTVFLLIMVPIAKEFGVSLTEVTEIGRASCREGVWGG